MGKHFIDRLTEVADLPDEPIPGQSLVEIAGERRVLIERHCGVIEYGRQQICVKVKFGVVCITGQGLELTRMTKEQLIISGCISCVKLERRGG